VSDHKLTIDIQKIAVAIQTIRAQMNTLEKIIEEALLKENQNDRDYVTMDSST
jgi:hypothetical protein